MPITINECGIQLMDPAAPTNETDAIYAIVSMLKGCPTPADIRNSPAPALVAILNRASRIGHDRSTLAKKVFVDLGVDAIVDHLAAPHTSIPRHTALLLNAAAHTNKDLCSQVMRRLVHAHKPAIDDLMSNGGYLDIGMAVNAAAHAHKDVCLDVMARAVNAPGDRFGALLRDREHQQAATALTATAHAGREFCSYVLDRYSAEVEKIMTRGTLKEVAIALDVALGSANPAERCSQTLAYWMRRGPQPGRIQGMTEYQAAIWTQAVEASGMIDGRYPEAPLSSELRMLNCRVGAFRRVHGALEEHPHDTRIHGLHSLALDQLVDQCSSLSPNQRLIDLHNLNHQVAEAVIRQALSHTTSAPAPVFIAGRGTHRRDGANPMADLVQRVCQECNFSATPDPGNNGRFLVNGDQGVVPQYAQLLARLGAASSNAQSVGGHAQSPIPRSGPAGPAWG